jgi:hypothetical protein
MNGKTQREILIECDHFPSEAGERANARFLKFAAGDYRGAGLMTGVRAAEEASIRAMPES